MLRLKIKSFPNKYLFVFDEFLLWILRGKPWKILISTKISIWFNNWLLTLRRDFVKLHLNFRLKWKQQKATFWAGSLKLHAKNFFLKIFPQKPLSNIVSSFTKKQILKNEFFFIIYGRLIKWQKFVFQYYFFFPLQKF